MNPLLKCIRFVSLLVLVAFNATSALAGATTTVLTRSANPVTVGQSVTLTATITGTSPTGSVTFKDGTTILGTGTVTAGVATLAASFKTIGVHSLTAVYGGDTSNAISSSKALAETVNIRTTTTALTSTVNPVATDQSFDLGS